ncbi:MAG TPA: HAD family hydrolase [Terriglobales bacterium]|nr:HAD family hydrolase [Terriglobales bacterium]
MQRKTGGTGRRPLISVVIFDLDDTLYDCLGQRVRAAHYQAARAMARAGVPASARAIHRVRLRAFERDPRLEPIDREVCRHFGIPFSARLHQVARRAFFQTPVRRLHLFPGVRTLLRTLHRRGVRIFIASYGHPPTQHAKVRSLGLDREPAVERIFFADTNKTVTKEQLFKRLLETVERDPRRFLVVGDRPSSEIGAGNRHGMHTVRVRHGEFSKLEPEGPDETPDFELRRVTDILKLPFRFGA